MCNTVFVDSVIGHSRTTRTVVPGGQVSAWTPDIASTKLIPTITYIRERRSAKPVRPILRHVAPRTVIADRDLSAGFIQSEEIDQRKDADTIAATTFGFVVQAFHSIISIIFSCSASSAGVTRPLWPRVSRPSVPFSRKSAWTTADAPTILEMELRCLS